MTEKKDWRVVKVTYIESKMTLGDALRLKRKLNREREGSEGWQHYFKVERMEDI